jgi:integrase
VTTTEQISPNQIAKDNFLNACKTAATRILYQKGLDYFMDYIRLEHEEYDKLLERDPKLIQMDIIRFITHMKKKNNSYQTISGYVSGIKHFLVQNDVITLNWNKIKKNFPSHEKVAEDRPYSHEEIKRLIEIASMRDKALILTLSSAGLRIGAIPRLRVKDLKPIDEYGIYQIHVYAKSVNSNYHTFCTPEARHAIDSYLEWRKRFSERITGDSPVFRTDYNAYGRIMRAPKPCTENAVTHTMDKLLRATGMRGFGLENQERKRRDIMRSHGLRKFWESNAYKAGMDHMYIRRLMGQKSGLEDAYLKLSEEELLEGDSAHVGYLGIIDQLTVNDENRLRKQVQTLNIDKKNMEQVLERIALLEDKILNQ